MSDLVAYTQRTLLVSLSQGPASDADAFCNPRLTRKPSTLTRRNTPDTDRTVGAMREPTGSPKTDPAVAPTIGIPRHGPDSVHSWITAGRIFNAFLSMLDFRVAVFFFSPVAVCSLETCIVCSERDTLSGCSAELSQLFLRLYFNLCLHFCKFAV